MKELQKAVEWLEHRHRTMQELANMPSGFKSEYMQAYNAGMKSAIKHYGVEIAKIRQMLDGYMIEDVDLSGGEKHVS